MNRPRKKKKSLVGWTNNTFSLWRGKDLEGETIKHTPIFYKRFPKDVDREFFGRCFKKVRITIEEI